MRISLPDMRNGEYWMACTGRDGTGVWDDRMLDTVGSWSSSKFGFWVAKVSADKGLPQYMRRLRVYHSNLQGGPGRLGKHMLWWHAPLPRCLFSRVTVTSTRGTLVTHWQRVTARLSPSTRVVASLRTSTQCPPDRVLVFQKPKCREVLPSVAFGILDTRLIPIRTNQVFWIYFHLDIWQFWKFPLTFLNLLSNWTKTVEHSQSDIGSIDFFENSFPATALNFPLSLSNIIGLASKDTVSLLPTGVWVYYISVFFLSARFWTFLCNDLYIRFD